jgi:hypothetical protein
MGKLAGKAAVVTRASKGIGAAGNSHERRPSLASFVAA